MERRTLCDFYYGLQFFKSSFYRQAQKVLTIYDMFLLEIIHSLHLWFLKQLNLRSIAHMSSECHTSRRNGQTEETRALQIIRKSVLWRRVKHLANMERDTGHMWRKRTAQIEMYSSIRSCRALALSCNWFYKWKKCKHLTNYHRMLQHLQTRGPGFSRDL